MRAEILAVGERVFLLELFIEGKIVSIEVEIERCLGKPYLFVVLSLVDWVLQAQVSYHSCRLEFQHQARWGQERHRHYFLLLSLQDHSSASLATVSGFRY